MREEKGGTAVKLKNYMEDLVLARIDKVLAQYPQCCRCEQCRLDIMALALNRLPPRYISSHKGDVFTRIEEMNGVYDVEVIKALVKAVELVHAHPRHERDV